MTHARVPESDGDSAWFPYGAPDKPARFPQGYPPGAPYLIPRPTEPRGADVGAQEPRWTGTESLRAPVPRHPWELPLLLVSVLITLTVAAAAAHTLWAHRSLDRWEFCALLLLPVGVWLTRGLRLAGQRSQSVKISPTQFPGAYRMIRELTEELGLRRAPDGYVRVGEGHRERLCGRAAGHGARHYIVLSSDLFEVGGRLRDPEALRFVIAHELGHVAAGHTSFLRRTATAIALPAPVLGLALSRAMEYTADDIAYARCPEGAHAVRILVGGKYLYPQVNMGEMADRARTERGFFVFLYNLLSPHPVHIRRMAALRERGRPGRVFR